MGEGHRLHSSVWMMYCEGEKERKFKLGKMDNVFILVFCLSVKDL